MLSDSGPGSFTKNFGNGTNYRRLQATIQQGFRGRLKPLTRDRWRENASVCDRDRQLIALNFFLCSEVKPEGDFVLIDEFVAQAIKNQHNQNFDRLALFSLHLAQSGRWHRSRWPDGRVAGWCNEFIRKVAWHEGAWLTSAFDEKSIIRFLDRNVSALPNTMRKILTNYQYLVKISGLLENAGTPYINTESEKWGAAACNLFWDRLTYQGETSLRSTKGELLAGFFKHEIHKLLGCTEKVGLGIAEVAAEQYVKSGGVSRFLR
jgi:hypothetical protein